MLNLRSYENSGNIIQKVNRICTMKKKDSLRAQI